MRKAALCAGITQVLYGTYAVAPELFGSGRMPVSNQFHDWLFRAYIFATSAILAIFFFLRLPKRRVAEPIWRSEVSIGYRRGAADN